ITGRMYSERLGKLHFVWLMVTYNVTFIPMFWLGIQGMNRRVADYPPEMAGVNLFASIATFFLAASFLVMVYNLVTAWVRGPVADANPWRARTLEWQTSSPPPAENFPTEPEVVGSPYDYGVPGAVHAVIGIAGGADTETKL
ncbi:MAG: cbb3-type cytochrome c oxidase subunit I, partial [Chloroflexi bacterium]|nr:cbb3-type cytochrome c oxidase subunit I [Chloroflexota bacterium]